jgi:hypothetical protein
VDARDAAWARSRPWFHDEGGYAACIDGRMHTLLLGVLGVDHANRDRLDNRRKNLRAATPSQNVMNTGKRRNNTSGYKGVDRRPAGWRARCRAAGVTHFGGFHETAEAAAKAYDTLARRLHGRFAVLNAPPG